MNGNKQERPNECPILNFNKRLYRSSLNKKFDTHTHTHTSRKLWSLRLCKNKQSTIPTNKVISGKPLKKC